MDRWRLYYYYMLLFKCLHSKMVIIIFNSSPRLTVINQLSFKTKEFFYIGVRAHCIKAFVHTPPHNGMITLKYNRFTTTTFVGWDFPNPYKIYSDLHIIICKRIIDCCSNTGHYKVTYSIPTYYLNFRKKVRMNIFV